MSAALARACVQHQHPPSHNIAADALRAFLKSHPATFSQKRPYSAQSAQCPDHESHPRHPIEPPHQKNWPTERERLRLENREFFTSLLSSAATKRDAKAYITRLKNPEKAIVPSATPTNPTTRPAQTQVNLGGLFGRARAVEESPIFSHNQDNIDYALEEQETLHVALIKISNITSMSDSIVAGIARTLSSLSRLSMAPCVVVDESDTSNQPPTRQQLSAAADRLVSAIESYSQSGARIIDNALSLGEDGRPRVFMRRLLTRPLRRGRIPVVVPIAYSDRTHQAINITADQALVALVRELSGYIQPRAINPDQQAHSTWKPISLDRIIVVDETGCIPSTKSIDKKHVFVNLSQEYSALQEELRSSTDGKVSVRHASNLRMFRDALQLLPHTSSGLLTTPAAAANIDKEPTKPISSVGTRRQKNPLIHNLLTDKPAYSSSLPSGRLAQDTSSSSATTSTFIKKGMPLIILPHPDAQVWKATSTPRLKLTDPRIDLKRLTYLVDDSFNRQLDVEAYLRRVNDRIAGVIIAGEYEGGAILTWETPPGASDDDHSRLVPYLDKFAVLKKSQGAGGVADIVFNAMVRTCFPNGVCWRSRKDNPVNKWYFERSRGTFKIPDTNWTMFWTTPDLLLDQNRQTFLDYEGVCRTVKPTWADGKVLVD
ncbi:hypothetical protein B0A52_01874 [Exophiala mesophila]|uniref:Amino-acid acetyltransferase, mitochondrial n=1 Tax=Exophiala mesophila TaxID=212818 RepID=A0A438NE89_EXOME|nr:hypothetical protein B0A52_01874 [Exophiala mesophila]